MGPKLPMRAFRLASILMVLAGGAAFGQDDGGAPSDATEPRPVMEGTTPDQTPEQTPEQTPASASDHTLIPAAPSVLGRTGAGPVEVGTLGTAEGPVAGVFNDANGGLGYSEWNGVDRAAAETALQGLPPPTSPTARLLLRELLLTAAPPPAGQANAPFNAVRLRKLMDAGLLNDAGSLAAQLRAPKDSETSRAQADALLLAGRDADACGDATAFRLDSDEQFWIELRAYCYALTNDPALDLTRTVLGNANPAFNALLAGIIAGKPRANVAFANPTSLDVRMMQRLKLAMNAGVANLGTAGALIAAQSAAAPKEVRIAAAEKILRAGALPPSTFAQVLDLVAIKPSELATAAAMARSGSLITALARLRAALKHETNPEKRAELIYTALRVGEEQGLLYEIAPVFAADAAAVVPQPGWASWAPTLVRALLIAGKPDAAENWLGAGNAAADDLAIVVALTLQDQTHVSRAQLALSNLQLLSLVNGEGAGARAMLYLGLFDALALAMPPDAQARVTSMMAQEWPGHRPSAATLRRIDDAALGNRRGEVALGVIAAIGRGPGDLAPDVTIRLVRALQTAGVRDGAHQLAAEAVLAR